MLIYYLLPSYHRQSSGVRNFICVFRVWIYSSSVQGGSLVTRERCTSNHTIQWLLGLQIYLVAMSLLLGVVAISTRNISHKNFKDTKKISALCFVIVLTLSMLLAYWYVLRLVRAHIVAVHGALQLAHYCIILECQVHICSQAVPHSQGETAAKVLQSIEHSHPKDKFMNS
jgi:hypothetical protein